MFLPRRAHAIARFLRSSRLHRHAVARTFILLKKFSSNCVGNASSPAKTVSLARISASDSRPVGWAKARPIASRRNDDAVARRAHAVSDAIVRPRGHGAV